MPGNIPRPRMRYELIIDHYLFQQHLRDEQKHTSWTTNPIHGIVGVHPSLKATK